MFFATENILFELSNVSRLAQEDLNNYSLQKNHDTIIVMLSGKCSFQTKIGSFSYGMGNVVYIPNNVANSLKLNKTSAIVISFINHNKNNTTTAEAVTLENFEQAEMLACKLCDIWNDNRQGYKYKCSAVFYEFLYFINSQQYNKTTSHTLSHKIKAATDYIQNNFKNQNIDIALLAKITFLSETYFRKLFKQIYGISPNKYITNLRLEYAAQLLKDGYCTVNEASYKSGFKDTKYFITLFKRKFGTTPKKYQHTHSENSK